MCWTSLHWELISHWQYPLLSAFPVLIDHVPSCVCARSWVCCTLIDGRFLCHQPLVDLRKRMGTQSRLVWGNLDGALREQLPDWLGWLANMSVGYLFAAWISQQPHWGSLDHWAPPLATWTWTGERCGTSQVRIRSAPRVWCQWEISSQCKLVQYT